MINLLVLFFFPFQYILYAENQTQIELFPAIISTMKHCYTGISESKGKSGKVSVKKLSGYMRW